MTVDPLSAFDDECAAFADAISLVNPTDLERETNCPPWNLHELIVHVVISIRLPDQLPDVAGDEAVASAADYFRRPERETPEYRDANVDRTRAIAATVPQSDVQRLLVDTWHRTASVARDHGLDARIRAGGRSYSFGSYLLTRVISVAAHGLDVATTLDQQPWTTPSALSAIRPVLTDLLEGEPPGSWSDLDLLEFGTGRRRPTADQMHELGKLARRFPLLS